MVELTDVGRPGTWMRYRPSLCEGCRAHCCQLPVEVSPSDLVRMGLATPDETTGSIKKLGRRLIKEGVIKSFRARSRLFILEQKQNEDCYFLGADRLCTIYDKRPEVCRNFPDVGPRPGYCPSRRK